MMRSLRKQLRTGKMVARPEGFGPPALCFEGRCSIQLSYGRADITDSKSFIAIWDIILKALTLYRKGRRSIQTELQANSPTIVSSSSYSDLFKRLQRRLSVHSVQLVFFGRTFKVQTLLSQRGVHFVTSVPE